MVTRVTKTVSRSTKTPEPVATGRDVLKSVRIRHSGWGQRSASATSMFEPFQSRTFFEAASNSPRLIHAPDVGPNSHNSEIERLRRKSRWMYANDPFYRQACRQIGNNTVHHGIKPNIKDKVLRKIWNRWTKEADARGKTDYYGMQHMGSVVTPRDGEHFLRIRRRRPGEMKSGINFQLQTLEADHCPLDKTETLPGGNVIVSGVEHDAIDRVIAYWLYDYHPRDWVVRSVGSGLPKRVPADDVIHVYAPDRFSDTRGYPWGASALTTAERYRTYDDVELERKILSSTRGGFYKKPRFAGDEETMYDSDDGDEAMFRPMHAGEYVQVPEGWDIQEATPAASDVNYGPYRRESLSGLAVAFGLAVELVTMNWEKLASDRQYRGLMLEIVRYIESIQYHMCVFQRDQRVWELVVSEAYLNGLWKPAEGKAVEDYYEVRWIMPKRGYIHPVQDVSAVATAIEKGLESRKSAVSANGWDVEDLDDENVEDTQRAEAKGLKYSMLGLNSASAKGLLAMVEQYGSAVRAGLITPQIADEIYLRQQQGLPPLSEEAVAHWHEQNGVRQPITLAKETPVAVGFGEQLVDPKTGEEISAAQPEPA
ncbi:phage portal protein [Neorhizobium tomejilense]|uniref:phage portal protein n=1 Tax=Neorhizobium tomejilense TaxID=2093828 RepID=UPI003ECDF83C